MIVLWFCCCVMEFVVVIPYLSLCFALQDHCRTDLTLNHILNHWATHNLSALAHNITKKSRVTPAHFFFINIKKYNRTITSLCKKVLLIFAKEEVHYNSIFKRNNARAPAHNCSCRKSEGYNRVTYLFLQFRHRDSINRYVIKVSYRI